MRSFASLLALAGLSVTPALAHEFKVGDLVVDHPYSFETAASAMSGIGYLSITNTGDTADRLIAVTGLADRATLHSTEINADGLARMVPKPDGITIAPGETVTLAPGGLHIMFMGLGGDPFELGEELAATLTFETAGDLNVVFNVEDRGTGTPEMDHSQHSMAHPFALNFAAMAGGAPVDCSTQIGGLGPQGDVTAGLNDLRFYVSNLTFHGPDGTALPATLDQTDFQLTHAAGSVALVDLTSNTDGTCAPGSLGFGEGTHRTNTAITGTFDMAQIATVSFDVGVPQPLMQAVIAAGSAEDAPQPLAEMYWNWASGYRHFVLNHTVDVADGTYGEGYLHIGSHDCGPAEAKALSDRDRCGFVNMPKVVLPVTDPGRMTIAIDLDPILAGLDFRAPVRDMESREIIGEQPGTRCHAMKMQADCATVFDAMGIDLQNGTSDPARNVAFKVLP